MSNLCQKMTEEISTILALTKEFDGIMKSNPKAARLLDIKKEIKLIRKEYLNDYHEHLWPPIVYQRIELSFGGLTAEEIQAKFEETDAAGIIKISAPDADKEFLDRIFQSEEFKKLQSEPRKIKLIKLSAEDLNITNKDPDIAQIYEKAKNMGLLLCSDSVVPYLRLFDVSQIPGNAYRVATNNKIFFSLYRSFDGIRWIATNLGLSGGFNQKSQFVFQLPDLEGDD